MKVKSALVTQASGSVGGFVWSHNRGGMYIRARATPTNPNSQFQQAIRAIVGNLAALWHNTLTPVQRAAWDIYALQVPLPDRLGEPRNVGGLAMYIRSNTPRLQVGMERVDDGPVIFTLPGLEALIMESPSAAPQNYDLDYREEPQVPETWLSEDGAGLLNYSSRPQNLSINYFKGPYRVTTSILGNSGTPATPPFTITSHFVFAQGQRLFARVQMTRADGRLSLPQYLHGDTVNGPAAAGSRPAPRPPTEDAPKEDRDPKRRKRRNPESVT